MLLILLYPNPKIVSIGLIIGRTPESDEGLTRITVGGRYGRKIFGREVDLGGGEVEVVSVELSLE
jgi:hypothetical protein